MLRFAVLLSSSCLCLLALMPRAVHAQASTQAVWQGECDETCVEAVDPDGNPVGGACMQYGEGEGMGDGCSGTLSDGCTLEVYCLPPIEVGELKAPDGTRATFCLNLLPEMAVALGGAG